MSLRSVLKDRARLHRKMASPVKVAGRTTFVDGEPGTWFAARLMVPQSQPEATPAGGAAKRAVLSPTLIFGTDDDEGSPVVIRFNDMLEVESEDLGNAIWQVDGEPRPYRKKRGIIAYEANLKRIETHDFERRSP